MAATLKVDIVSAENSIFSGEATLVSASAQLGEVGIAPGHAAFISRIRPGEVRVRTPGDDEELDIFVSGGILEVQPHHVTILADTALREGDIDEAAAEKAKEEAEAALAGNKPEEIDYKAVQMQLAQASAQLQFLKKIKNN